MRETFTAIVKVTGEVAPGEAGEYSNQALADDLRDDVFDSIREYAGLNAIITEVQPAPERVKVWVAHVTNDDMDYGRPATYVSASEADVIKVVRLQQGVPAEVPDDELGDWFSENKGAAIHWDSYYMETGNE